MGIEEKAFRKRVTLIINNIYFQMNQVEEYVLRKASEEIGHTKIKNLKMAIQELELLPHVELDPEESDQAVLRTGIHEHLKGSPNGGFSQTAIPKLVGNPIKLPVIHIEKVVHVAAKDAKRLVGEDNIKTELKDESKDNKEKTENS